VVVATTAEIGLLEIMSHSAKPSGKYSWQNNLSFGFNHLHGKSTLAF